MFGVFLKPTLLAEKFPMVARVFDSTRPVMRESDIHWVADLHELANIQLSNMIHAMEVIRVVWKTFKMRLSEVIALPDARHGRNSQWTKANNIGCTKIVDVGGRPSAVVELEHVIARLMVATAKDCQVRGDALTTVEFVKVPHGLPLCRNRDASSIVGISKSLNRCQIKSSLYQKSEHKNETNLEVTTDDHQINGLPALCFGLCLQERVNLLKAAVCLNSSSVSDSLLI
jgi:hypothetical protein